MRRPFPITWLLFLLVLLPTGVLAALGFRAADAFDAADTTRLRTEVAVAGDELERAVRAASVGLEKRIDAALRETAAGIAERADEDAAVSVRAALQATGIEVGRVTLYDARGRSLWPREFVPSDEDAGDTGQPSATSLLAYLRQRADRAYFAEGGSNLEAAAQVWRDARPRLQSPGLQRLADVEVARLAVRASDNPRTAVQVLEALRERWGETSPEDAETARPWLLLQMAAAAADASVRVQLGEDVAQGRTALTPLTVEERRRLRALVAATPEARDPAGASSLVVFASPVSHGARLEVEIEAGELLRLLLVALGKSSFGSIRYQLLAPDLASQPWKKHGRAVPFGFELPGGVAALVVYEHEDFDQVRAGSNRRRLMLTAGVALLFLVTLLGLGLTQRAMERERAARRLRDEFIANVTHEVRTPLTSVLLHSELLAAEGTGSARRQEHAQVVRAQGKRLARLVDDMLDFSALERGSRTLESVPVDLGAACREAAAPYAVLAEREDVTLELTTTGEEVAAMGDPAALARILANLLGNAWKHGRPARDGGPGRIAVRAFDPGGVPTVEVCDDGPGIPRAEREQIFARFGRGRGADKKEGAGIGLSLSHDLAKVMGGTLDLREQDGETIFRLRLPPVLEFNVDAETPQ